MIPTIAKNMNFLNNISINQINLIGALFSSLMILFFALLVSHSMYKNFLDEMEKIKSEYYTSQKESIVAETNRALKFIEYKYHNSNKPLDELQDEIVETIEQMRLERDGSGYVFIYTFEGICKADPILEQNKETFMLDFEDPNGKRVIYELIEVSKNSDGGFVEYVWNKPIANTLSPKISYAKSFKPWGWMVGSGVYLDTINEILDEKERIYEEESQKMILYVLLVGVLLFGFVFYISKLIAGVITKETEIFTTFFKKAANNQEYINVRALKFKEFKTISKNANMMLKEIHNKTKELKELNSTLEQRIELKTKKLRAQKEELEQVLEAQDRFLKNAIHEIFTPIGIIYANIDLLELKSGKNRHLLNIEAGAKTIHNIYNDLSYLIKKDRVENRVKKVSFSEFIKERVDYFYELAIGNGVRLESKIEDSLYIIIDCVELERVVDNSIQNAIKYSFEGREITVNLYKNGNNILFEVANYGKEIEDCNKIFERFYREDRARGGFGIGLNIIKEICDKYGIIIEVESKNSKNIFRYVWSEERCL